MFSSKEETYSHKTALACATKLACDLGKELALEDTRVEGKTVPADHSKVLSDANLLFAFHVLSLCGLFLFNIFFVGLLRFCERFCLANVRCLRRLGNDNCIREWQSKPFKPFIQLRRSTLNSLTKPNATTATLVLEGVYNLKQLSHAGRIWLEG